LHEEIPLDALTKCSEELVDIIKQFLERDVKKRLGVKETGGYDGLKKHPLFRKLDWNAVENKKAVPPFIPDVIEINNSPKKQTLMPPTN
jgi:serine/threonine kinase 32